MSLVIVLFAIFLQISPCKAQSVVQTDTQRVIALNTKAWAVRVQDPALSVTYSKEAIAIAQRHKYNRGLSYSYNILGNYFKIKGQYDSSLFYYVKSLGIRKTLRDTLGIARSCRNVRTVEDLKGDRDKAIKTGLGALQLITGKKDPELLRERAWIENHLGYIYFCSGANEKGVSMVHEAKDLFVRLNDDNGLAATCMNLGTFNESLKLYPIALKEYNTALPILIRAGNQEELAKVHNGLGNVYYHLKKYQPALFNYKQSLHIKQALGFTENVKGVLLNMGIVYEALGKIDSADRYYNQALQQSLEAGDRQTEQEAHWAFGTLLADQKKYSRAIPHLLIAHKLMAHGFTSVENSNLLKDISRTYNELHQVDSALYYSNQYTAVIDSLNNAMIRSIQLGSTLRENNKDKKLVEEKSKLQSIIIIGMCIGMFFLLIIFFLYYRFARSKKNMLELRELVKDKELKALDAMLEGQNEERKRLAAELHDTIGSMLSATKFSFKAMEKSMEKMMEDNRGQYGKINAMLDETMESVRRISHNMAAGIFSEKGIEGALTELCQTFEQPGRMHVHLNVHGLDNRLDYDIEVNIYRMVQELLTNVIKHANASEVTIQLVKSSDNINLTVEDDGRGFDPEASRRKKGIGLSNVELRIKKLSGTLNIDSGKGKGTTIIIDLPIKSEV